MQDRVQIIKEIEAWRQKLMDFGTLDANIERQLEETQVIAELVKVAVKENASTAQSQEAYLKSTKPLLNGMRKRLRNWKGCRAYAPSAVSRTRRWHFIPALSKTARGDARLERHHLDGND